MDIARHIRRVYVQGVYRARQSGERLGCFLLLLVGVGIASVGNRRVIQQIGHRPIAKQRCKGGNIRAGAGGKRHKGLRVVAGILAQERGQARFAGVVVVDIAHKEIGRAVVGRRRRGVVPGGKLCIRVGQVDIGKAVAGVAIEVLGQGGAAFVKPRRRAPLLVPVYHMLQFVGQNRKVHRLVGR